MEDKNKNFSKDAVESSSGYDNKKKFSKNFDTESLPDEDKKENNSSSSAEELNQKEASSKKNKDDPKTDDGKDSDKVDANDDIEKNYLDEISALREEKLRLLADMENLRKRSDKEKVDSIKYGSANLARDMLVLGDNLSRALESIPAEENKSESMSNLVDGLKMIQKDFISILERHGIKKIDAMNNKFDHNYHQAVVEVETDAQEEGLVVQEIQSGYTMHERLLRPTMAGISKKLKKDQK